MKSQWTQGIEKLKSGFTKENLIVVVLTGVLFLVIALPTGKDEDDAGTSDGEGAASVEIQTLTESEDGTADALERYCARQEQRLEEALSRVEGVGSVEVMLTVSASRELVVLKDTQSTESDTAETDAQGGTRIVAQSETSETTVSYNTDSGGAPYIVKTLEPEIEGVLVIAEGADSGTVRRELVQMVQALYDLEANHVLCVAKEK